MVEPGSDRELITSFRDEVKAELEEERGMLELARRPRRNHGLWDAIIIVLLLASLALLLMTPNLIYLWVVIGILLYSYNFIILMIPTTTEGARPTEVGLVRKKLGKDPWLALRLLMKQRYLAIEIGLTVFLGGMVPLAISFSTIFGVGLAAVLFHLSSDRAIDPSLAVLIAAQILAIMLFYLVMITLRPQAQGITKYVKRWQCRVGQARTRGSMALSLIVVGIAGATAALVLLIIGAILLPGFTISSLLSFLELPRDYALITIGFVVITQLFVMRHLQGHASRKMAIDLLEQRLEKLENIMETLQDALDGRTRLGAEGLSRLHHTYYQIVIYDIFRQDIFSHSPVFLVGPSMKYVLDPHVIEHFNRDRENSPPSPPNPSGTQ